MEENKPVFNLNRRSNRLPKPKEEFFDEDETRTRRKVKRFQCTACKRHKSFASMKKLARHISKVHKDKDGQSNVCQICSASLTSASYLRRHMLAKHPASPKIFVCDYDGKKFSLKDYLRVHMDRHRKYQILTCTVCLKSFISKHTFRKHLMMHIQKHECSICSKVFSQKSLLENHVATKHSDDLPYSCNFCTRLFPSKSARNNHQYMTHKNNTTELKHKCDECKISFEMKEELRIHSFIHFKGEIKTCLECYQIFKTTRLLKIHMEKHNTEKSFQCTTCGDLFTFQTGLAKHIRMNRCKGPRSLETKDDATKNDEVAIAKNLLNELVQSRKRRKPSNEEAKKRRVKAGKDVIQDESFKQTHRRLRERLEVKKEIKEESVILEMKETRKIRKARKFNATTIEQRSSRARHFMYTCDFCGAEMKFKKKIIEHIKRVHNKCRYKCGDCDSAFKSIRQLVKHSTIVHGVKLKLESFSCKVCDRKFETKSAFKTHTLCHDDNARAYVCTTCNGAFKSIGNLHRHEATHVETREFHCSDCPKSFKTKLSLKIHKEAVHVDVKVFVNCPVCNLIVLETTLKAHVKNQHTDEGRDKPFKCVDCNKTFRSEIVGLRHWSAVHDPKPLGVIYRCPECPELQFFRHRDLKEHSFIHFDGIVQQCYICSKKFTSKRLLTIHKAVHNEDGFRNFPCTLCEMVQFKTRGGLRKHTINIHGYQQEDEFDA